MSWTTAGIEASPAGEPSLCTDTLMYRLPDAGTLICAGMSETGAGSPIGMTYLPLRCIYRGPVPGHAERVRAAESEESEPGGRAADGAPGPARCGSGLTVQVDVHIGCGRERHTEVDRSQERRGCGRSSGGGAGLTHPHSRARRDDAQNQQRSPVAQHLDDGPDHGPGTGQSWHTGDERAVQRDVQRAAGVDHADRGSPQLGVVLAVRRGDQLLLDLGVVQHQPSSLTCNCVSPTRLIVMESTASVRPDVEMTSPAVMVGSSGTVSV